jgi:hypothetical protein
MKKSDGCESPKNRPPHLAYGAYVVGYSRGTPVDLFDPWFQTNIHPLCHGQHLDGAIPDKYVFYRRSERRSGEQRQPIAQITR